MSISTLPLMEFPSFPNLSRENQLLMTKFACMIYAVAEKEAVFSSSILVYLRNSHIVGTQIPTEQFISQNGIEIGKFLKLPEISSFLSMFGIVNGKRRDRYYKSLHKMFREDGECHLFHFRCMMVMSISNCIERNLADEFGAVTFENVCSAFNELASYHGWVLDPKEKLRFLKKQTLNQVLVKYCYRDFCVTSSANGAPGTIRFRQHPEFIMSVIELQHGFAQKAFEAYKFYQNAYKNSFDILRNYAVEAGLTPHNLPLHMKSYGTCFDNIYAALHYSSNVKDYKSLVNVVQTYTKERFSRRVQRYTTNHILNILIHLISPPVWKAIALWDGDKKATFFKILEEMIGLLTEEYDRDYLLSYLYTLPNDSEHNRLTFWRLHRVAHNVLQAANTNKFVSEQEISNHIKMKFSYNLLQILQEFDMKSILDLMENHDVAKTMVALVPICVFDKSYPGFHKMMFRNMKSIMDDENYYQVFPYNTVQRLITCIQKAIEEGDHSEGYVTQYSLYARYSSLYGSEIDSDLPHLFGADYQRYSDLVIFLAEFNLPVISWVSSADGIYGYGIARNYKEELAFLNEKQISQTSAANKWAECLNLGREQHKNFKAEYFCSMVSSPVYPYNATNAQTTQG